MIGSKITRREREPEPGRGELPGWLESGFAGTEDDGSTEAAGMDATIGIGGSTGVLIVFLFLNRVITTLLTTSWMTL